MYCPSLIRCPFIKSGSVNEPSNKIELKKVRNKNVIKQKLYYNKYKILFLKKKNVIIFKLANLRKPWNVYYTILNFYRKTLQLRV